MIQIDNLTKRYGSKTAVNDLSLSIAGGEVFAFLGPNGAGKTTTIKILTGLLRPTEGRATVAGHDVVKEPEAAKACMAYVPDEPFLYDKLTGYEYVHFVGGLYGVSQEAIDSHIQTFFGMFNLLDAAHNLIESYSHGMRQKVVITGALVHDPQVLIVDEPMVGLDPRSARLIKDLLKERCANGMTVFLSIL